MYKLYKRLKGFTLWGWRCHLTTVSLHPTPQRSSVGHFSHNCWAKKRKKRNITLRWLITHHKVKYKATVFLFMLESDKCGSFQMERSLLCIKEGFLYMFLQKFPAMISYLQNSKNKNQSSKTGLRSFFVSIHGLIQKHTLFSIEHSANFQPTLWLRLHKRASIHSLFPELGTPVTTVNSPGTTWSANKWWIWHQMCWPLHEYILL